MTIATTQTEFRKPEQIRADEEIADLFEKFVVVDSMTGWTLHAATDERRQLMRTIAAELNNAIVPSGTNVPFIWDGKSYRIIRASFRSGKATVEVAPSNQALEDELRNRIEAAPHHVLTFYQGFGYICFPEDYARYQDA